MKLRYLFILTMILLVGLVAYSVEKKINYKPQTSRDILVVSTVNAYPHTLTENLSVTGSAVAQDEVTIFTELPNVRVKEILVDIGSVVQKGQKLVMLDDEVVLNQIKLVQAELDRAKDALNRLEPLQGSGNVSEMSITEAKSAYQAALSRVEDAKLLLRKTVILSPEDGIIFERKVTLGDFGRLNEPLFKIAKKNIIEAQLRIPEGRVHQISFGQSVQLKLPGKENVVTGKIRLISPQIDPMARVANIRVQIENTISLPIGSFITATIQLQSVKGFALPYTAIQENKSGNFVWLVDSENKVKPQAVSVLLVQDHLALVKELDTTVNVIAKAGSFVNTGDEVKILEKQK